MPGPPPAAGVPVAAVVAVFVAAGVEVLAAAAGGGVEGFAVAAGGGAAVALPTFTIDENAEICLAVRPAFDRSPTELYGRPAMIFLAVDAPMPGTDCNSAALAVFRSTGALGAILPLFLAVAVAAAD